MHLRFHISHDAFLGFMFYTLLLLISYFARCILSMAVAGVHCVWYFALPQAGRALKIGKYDKGQAMPAEEMAWWLNQCHTYLSKDQGDLPANPKNLQRVSAYKLILAIDHALLNVAGHGLGKYLNKIWASGHDLSNQAVDMPILSLCMDQGLIGVGAANFLQNELHMSLVASVLERRQSCAQAAWALDLHIATGAFVEFEPWAMGISPGRS